MIRTRLIEVDFFKFKKALDAATRDGKRINPDGKDKARWKEWIKEHQIPEAGAMAIAKNKVGKPTPVVIDDADDAEWSGFYVFSETDIACWKVARVEE